MESQENRNNYEFLKAKVGQINLKELLRPLFQQLLDQTINTNLFAMNLYGSGVISLQEMEECLNESTQFCQNLELYQRVEKKNAGEELLDALYESKNFDVIQLLRGRWDNFTSNTQVIQPAKISNVNTNNLNIPTEDIKPIVKDGVVQLSWVQPTNGAAILSTASRSNSSSSSNQSQISILVTFGKMRAPPNTEWIQTFGEENLSRINESTLDWTLVRIQYEAVTSSDTVNCRKYFNPKDFHPEEQHAITKFLEGQLILDLDHKTLAQPPTELYINARSFTLIEWQWLSKILLLCKDTLENLWFQNVDYREYSSGIKWLKNLKEDKEPGLRFSRLKFFIFQGTHYTLNSETFHSMLAVIKSINYSIPDFWPQQPGCHVEIWTDKFNRCNILMDPTSGTLYMNGCIEADLKGEVDKIFDLKTAPSEGHQNNTVQVAKLYFDQVGFLRTGMNRQILTHLFLRCAPTQRTDVFQNVVSNLGQCERLQKLLLSADAQWPIDLMSLDVLDKLLFVYLRNANCSGAAVDSFPWRTSVRTLIFNRCQVTLAAPGLESVAPIASCLMLERKRQWQQNPGVLPQPFGVSMLSKQDVSIEIMREFRQ